MSELRKTVADLSDALDALEEGCRKDTQIRDARYQEGLLPIRRRCFEQLGHVEDRFSMATMFGRKNCIICGADMNSLPSEGSE